MPLRIRWPSIDRLRDGGERVLHQHEVGDAAGRLADPLPIAIARFAFLSGSTSFTPSPIIAT